MATQVNKKEVNVKAKLPSHPIVLEGPIQKTLGQIVEIAREKNCHVRVNFEPALTAELVPQMSSFQEPLRTDTGTIVGFAADGAKPGMYHMPSNSIEKIRIIG